MTETIFACVRVGTKYPVADVNVLVDMIRRNLPEGHAARFVCLTDDPAGLDEGIDVAFCPPGFEGWWAKLFLFSPRIFPAGARVIYFDLDTVIHGPFDELLGYRGPLAMLRDFYHLERLGSGVMLWQAGECEDILQAYILAGMPTDIEGGDQAFIEGCRPKAARLQDMFPGLLCSYKVHCEPDPPDGAAIICFHGFPTPAQASAPWIKGVWKKGGLSLGRVKVDCNTSDEIQFANVAKAVKRAGLGVVRGHDAHDRVAVICGSGPSLADTFPYVARAVEQGADLFVLNGAGRYLRECVGLLATWQVIMDARALNTRFVGPWASEFLIASICDEAVIDAAVARGKTSLFHPLIDGIDAHIPGNVTLIGGGVTVGMTALMLAHAMGYRTMHLHGYDSSYRDGDRHVLAQPVNAEEAKSFPVTVNGRVYQTNAAMYAQAKAFPAVAAALAEADSQLLVHGTGLLPEVAHSMLAAPKEIAA